MIDMDLFFFGGGVGAIENVQDLVVMVAEPIERTKKHCITHFKMLNLQSLITIRYFSYIYNMQKNRRVYNGGQKFLAVLLPLSIGTPRTTSSSFRSW